jgi:hypothetical protein
MIISLLKSLHFHTLLDQEMLILDMVGIEQRTLCALKTCYDGGINLVSCCV